jgi:dolichol kinase
MNCDPMIPLRAEMIRKGIHLFALVIPIGYSLVTFPTAIAWLLASALVAIIIDISRFRQWRLWSWVSWLLTPIIREHEVKGGFTGASYILTTSLICVLLFPKTIAIAAIVFIIIGDTAAAMIGRLYGQHKLIGKKSVEGSAACFVSVILVSFLIPGLPWQAAIIGAFTATVVEALSGKFDDNMTVPIISGAVMLLVMHLLGDQQAVFFAAFQ